MTASETGKLITYRIHKGNSGAVQRHTEVEDVNYIAAGTGILLCNGSERRLSVGEYNIFKKDSDYSIINTGNEDLVLLSYIKEA